MTLNSTALSENPSAGASAAANWLTLERAGYALALLIALVLRLAALGQRPLAPEEATQAWSALSMLRGLAELPLPATSPILLSLQWLTFAVAEPTAWLARIGPALAGTGLVLLPYLLRWDLGRPAALIAAFLLAFSASLTFWSRSGTGDSFAILAALALLVFLRRARQAPSQPQAPAQDPAWPAAALALLLLSAAIAYSALLLLVPVAVFWHVAGERAASSRLGSAINLRAGLVLLALLVLGATAFLLNPAGLAAAAELPASWLRQFTVASGYGLPWLGQLLLLGEPLLLVAGIAGLVLGLRRPAGPHDGGHGGRRLFQGLALWLALALLLALRPGRGPVDISLLVLPLALATGHALATLVRRFGLRGQELEGIVLAVAILAVVGSAGVWFVTYVGQPALNSGFALFAALAAVVLVVLLVVFALLFGARVTVQVGLVMLATGLFLLGFRATMLVNHNGDGLRWGSVAYAVGAPDGENMTHFLDQLAAERGQDRHDLDVTVVVRPGQAPSPQLMWSLRRVPVRFVAGVSDLAGDPVVVSSAQDPPPLDESFSGRSFRLSERWWPEQMTAQNLLQWLVFGKFDTLKGEERAVIWLRTATD